MAVRSLLKEGRYLEWFTQPPYCSNCPRESQPFIFQNTECYFQFARISVGNNRFHSCIYLKQTNDPIQLEPFRIKIYCTYNGRNLFSPSCYRVFNTEDFICSTDESHFTEVREITRCDPFIKLFFVFRDQFGLSIRLVNNETDEKSCQTPSYLDARFSSQSLSSDLQKYLETDSSHDAQFICGNRTFKAHKSVLGSRSRVLKAMLQSDMAEGKTGMVQIKDVESTVFEKFLRYVYTGNLPELTIETAKELYEIGDKYSVEALKKECGFYLLDNISQDNACDMLVLSDQHSDPDFKEKVVMYIMEEILPTTDEDWEYFCESHPALANQVLNRFCQTLISYNVCNDPNKSSDSS